MLVIGATGGVGTAVLPLPATATPGDGDLLRDLGATEVLDYRAADPVGAALRQYPSGVDAVHGAMREVAGHAAAGRLRATIGRSHPLDEAGRACVEFAREHTTGKVVVTMA